MGNNKFRSLLSAVINAVKWMHRKRIVILLFITFTLVAVLALEADAQALLAMAIVPGIAGGRHVTDEPLTTDLTREASPGLLLNEIDQQIVKIRPWPRLSTS